jgi:hypothetical protein
MAVTSLKRIYLILQAKSFNEENEIELTEIQKKIWSSANHR